VPGGQRRARRFVLHNGLSGLFDFGDGLVGLREYDRLCPLCFLAAGDATRIHALFDDIRVIQVLLGHKKLDYLPQPTVSRFAASLL
jgi:hypothetical protein